MLQQKKNVKVEFYTMFVTLKTTHNKLFIEFAEIPRFSKGCILSVLSTIHLNM